MPVKGDFYCKTCQQKMKGRLAMGHHKRGHEVWHLDLATGEMSHRYGTRPPDKIETVAKKPQITAEGEEHIKEHATGYAKDEHDVIFILNRETGKITDIRHKYPLLMPIYELCHRDMGYNGSFPQFLADAVETLFASAGYELVLAPKRQGEVYDEVARLKTEGRLAIHFETGGITLEVVDGHKDKGSKTRVRTGGGSNQSTRKDRGGQKKPAESE